MQRYQQLLDFLRSSNREGPCIAIDLNLVKTQYEHLTSLLPEARIFYAVKANPAPQVIARLKKLGASFETASIAEVNLCLEAGVSPNDILYGNPIKSPEAIEAAYQQGITLFTFDSLQELEKIASYAPNAYVICRIHSSGHGALWPLSRKFGCTRDQAVEWMIAAKAMALNPAGISFHVGSQQTHIHAWEHAIIEAAHIFKMLAEEHIFLQILNVGGGYPVCYRNYPHPPIAGIGKTIQRCLQHYFPQGTPDLFIEPGRFLVAEAGILETEVLLVTYRGKGQQKKRWVYLDAGKYNGFTETEVTEFELITDKDGEFAAPVVLAGPTCDSMDIIYEKKEYRLPLTITIGDKLHFLSAGAYTHSYASIYFNGFPPLPIYCIN